MCTNKTGRCFDLFAAFSLVADLVRSCGLLNAKVLGQLRADTKFIVIVAFEVHGNVVYKRGLAITCTIVACLQSHNC